MLSPDQLQDAGDAVAAIYSDMEARMLDHLVGAMLDGSPLTQRTATELNLLAQSQTAALRQIVEENRTAISDALYETAEQLLAASDKDDAQRLGSADVTFPAQLAATAVGMQLVLDRDNLDMVEGAKRAFLACSIEAVAKANSGLFTADQALHAAVRKLEREGISVISYRNAATGVQTVQNKVDVAVRRHIRTQIAQDGARMTLNRMEGLGVALVEVSSHEGSRPTHAEWQGRVYSLRGDVEIDGVRYRDFYSATGYGSVDGLLGANCRHSFGPYLHGAKRAYHPDPKSATGLPNDEIYELTQKQRYMERQIRAAKRELRGAQQLYDRDSSLSNKTALLKAQQRLRSRQEGLRGLIEEANAKCKPGTKALHRNRSREWAGDMPPSAKVSASNRKLDAFLDSKAKQLKAAGVSKARMRAALSGEMMRRGGTAKDFASLGAGEQQGIFGRLLAAIEAKLPSTKKANAGKHARKAAAIDRSAPVYSKLEKRHVDRIAEIIEGSDNAAARTYLAYENRLRLLDGKHEKGAHFSIEPVGVNLNIHKVFSDKKRPSMNTWMHEFGHHIDYISTGSSDWKHKAFSGMKMKDVSASTAYKDGVFGKTIKKEVDAIINAREKDLLNKYKTAARNYDVASLYRNGFIDSIDHYRELKAMVDNFGNPKWFKKEGYMRYDTNTLQGQQTTVDQYLGAYALKPTRAMACELIEKEINALADAQRCDISDIFEGATNGEVRPGWGHLAQDLSYWDPDGLALSREAFAEMFSANTSNPASLKILKEWLPESVRVFDEIIKAIEGGAFNG